MSREIEMLRWLGRHGATAEDLARLHGCAPASVERPLARLHAAGLLIASGELRGEPQFHVASAAGLRVAGLSALPAWRPSARIEGHQRAVSACAVWLQLEFGRDCEVLSEHELSRFPGGWPQWSLRAPRLRQATGGLKRPDLLLLPRSAADGLPLAVEVELSCKGAEQLRALCSAWRNCRSLAGALYLAAPSVLEPLRSAIAATDAGGRVALLPLADQDVPRLRRRGLLRPAAALDLLGSSASAAPGAPYGLQLALLRLCARFGLCAATDAQLALGCDQQNLNAAIVALDRAGQLRCGRFLRAEGLLLWAAPAGLRRCRCPALGPFRPSAATARVHVERARLAIALERHLPGVELRSRRQLCALERDQAAEARMPPILFAVLNGRAAGIRSLAPVYRTPQRCSPAWLRRLGAAAHAALPQTPIIVCASRAQERSLRSRLAQLRIEAELFALPDLVQPG